MKTLLATEKSSILAHPQILKLLQDSRIWGTIARIAPPSTGEKRQKKRSGRVQHELVDTTLLLGIVTTLLHSPGLTQRKLYKIVEAILVILADEEESTSDSTDNVTEITLNTARSAA